MTLKIKTIHIGVGGRGTWPLELLQHDRRWQPVALVDAEHIALETAADLAGLGREHCFSTLDAALDAVDADAVIVITPSGLHYRFVHQALVVGKHVLVEKPFVHRLDQAQHLVELASQRNLCLVVAQNYRFAAPQRTLRRLLADKTFGPARYSSLIYHRHRPQPRTFTMPHAMLIEMSVHHFDDMRAVFGAAALDVAAHSFNPPWSAYPGAAAVHALFRFERDLHCLYQGTFTSHDDRLEWRIECRDAALCWDGDDNLYTIANGGPRQRLPLDHIITAPEQCILDAWYAYIADGLEPEISGRANLGTLAMIDTAIRSSDERCIAAIDYRT